MNANAEELQAQQFRVAKATLEESPDRRKVHTVLGNGEHPSSHYGVGKKAVREVQLIKS